MQCWDRAQQGGQEVRVTERSNRVKYVGVDKRTVWTKCCYGAKHNYVLIREAQRGSGTVRNSTHVERESGATDQSTLQRS